MADQGAKDRPSREIRCRLERQVAVSRSADNSPRPANRFRNAENDGDELISEDNVGTQR